MRNSKLDADDLQAPPASSIENPFANETPKRQAQHREIARRYRLPRGQRRGSPKVNVRICELERVLVDRYGPVLPDDDAGRDDVRIMAHHLAHLADATLRISAWVRRCAPWMGDDEIAELIEMVVPKPLKWTADQLAERIGLDYATRTRLGIKTIGSTDVKKAERVKLRKERAAARAMARRAKAGARPQALSAARTEPWKAEGIGRSKWFDRRRKGTDGTTSCAATLVSTNGYETVQGAPPP